MASARVRRLLAEIASAALSHVQVEMVAVGFVGLWTKNGSEMLASGRV